MIRTELHSSGKTLPSIPNKPMGKEDTTKTNKKSSMPIPAFETGKGFKSSGGPISSSGFHNINMRRRRTGPHQLFLSIAIALFCLSGAHAQLFGTLDGYDVGGDNPICWRSEQSLKEFNTAAMLDFEQFTFSNSLFLNMTSEEIPELLPTCMQNTNFTITPTYFGKYWGVRNVIESGTSVRFVVELGLPFSEDLRNASRATIWLRLVECNVRLVGFCQPFLDIPWEIDGRSHYSTDAEAPLDLKPFGNTTAASGWLKLDELDLTTKNALPVTITQSITVFTPEDITGVFHVIGHIATIVETVAGENITRFDMANMVEGTPFEVADPAEIRFITKTTKILCGVLVGFFGLVLLVIFCFIVKHRNHRVMTLAQGGLLAWMQACSFLGVMLSVFVLPLNDTFCSINTISLIPITMVPSIMVGRLWRVYTTLIVASRLGKRNALSSARRKSSWGAEERVMKFLAFIAFSRLSGSRSSQMRESKFRQKTTLRDTVRLILVLSLPQTIFQLLDIFLFPSRLGYEIDDNGIGKNTCMDEGFPWVKYVGLALLAVQYLLAMYVAWCSRDLPTAFNEKSQLFHAAAINAVVSLVVVGLNSLYSLPSTSPDTAAILTIILALTFATVTTWLIVVPRVRQVLSGEEVVLTNVLRGMQAAAWQIPTVVTAAFGETNQGYAAGHPPFVQPVVPPKRDETKSPRGTKQKSDEDPEGETRSVTERIDDHLVQMDEIVRSVKKSCLHGRAIEHEEWEELKTVSERLVADVDKMVASRPNIEDGGISVVKKSGA